MEKGTAPGVPWWSCWPGEAVGQLPRSWGTMRLAVGSMFGFLCLVLHWKQEQKFKRLLLLMKSWLFRADCYVIIVWLPGPLLKIVV